MRTSKPISTISYNTENYLKGKLEELKKNRTISDYMYILHFAEEDESKNHTHVFIEPNKMLDTMALQENFREIDPKDNTKLLGCINFHSSKVDDWILYSMHFEPYLVSKGQSRKYHYKQDDFRFADELTFEALFNHAMYQSDWALNNQRVQWIKNRLTNPEDLLFNGSVPLQQAGQLLAVKRLLLDRNGRTTHTPIEVDEDGVILEPVDKDKDGLLKLEQGTFTEGFIPAEDIEF